MTRLACCVWILATSIFSSLSSAESLTKGTQYLICPKPSTFGICVEECSSDDDCGPKELCCSNGCGHTCQTAIDCSKAICPALFCPFGTKALEGSCCPVCKEKPGTCPKELLYTSEKCEGIKEVETCLNDESCPGAEKCCFDGCGKSCQLPDPDCSMFACEFPSCNNTFTPIGQCCQQCKPDCSKAVCTELNCKFGKYKPTGQCCEKCLKQDCKALKCLPIACEFGSYTPEGQCCPVCKEDCSIIGCDEPICKDPTYVPKGKCCPVCKPDCSSTICPAFICLEGSTYQPEGECCPKCRTNKPGKCPAVPFFTYDVCERIKFNPCLDDQECNGAEKCCSNGCGLSCQIPDPDCSTVLCLKPECNNTYTPLGGCCDECKPDCSDVLCPQIKCQFGSYKPLGKCCQECMQEDCSVQLCEKLDCKDTYVPEGQCCSACKQDCRVVRCGKPDCEPNTFIPNGQCCPVCKPDKPGECPKQSFSMDECRDQCSSDHECKGEQKCCFNGICNTCQTPIEKCPTERTDTCGTIVGLTCPAKSTCLFKESFPDAGGQCCTNKPIEACFEKKQPGPCLTEIQRYYYDTERKKCDNFVWSGCGETVNNFETLEYCKASCETPLDAYFQCKLPLITGPCEAYIPSFGFNSTTCTCEKFIYGGCRGNDNQFKTFEECSDRCENVCQIKPYLTCLLPKDGIKCSATQKKFYYDTKSCQCKKVRGKKCEGKKLFPTKQDCELSCKGMACPSTACNLPKVVGTCKGSFKRFFFNKHTCQCEEFVYGGCGGNGNKYETREECEAMCRDVQCPVCNLPPEGEKCKQRKEDAQEKWYYDASENQCKTFSFEGCGGNPNQFDSKEECHEFCGSAPQEICSLPKEYGSCNEGSPRYFYDSKKNKCKKFKWKGCKLNLNNFHRKKHCNEVCRK